MQIQRNNYLSVLLGLLVLISCSDNEEITPVDDQLELLVKYKIDVPEPSGLAIDQSGSALYTVSDNTNKVYKISAQGEVIRTFGYSGNDLEGVSLYKDDKLLLAEERLKQIVVFDMLSGSVQKHRIDYQNNEDNSGIEGVSYNSHDGSTFILNEKNPGLMIRLSSDFSIVKSYDLSFASDYSGIFYDNGKKELWIVSDQKKTINQCTLNGKLIKSYSVNIDKVEGIVLTNNKIFVVSDADAYLYVYKRPQG